MIIEINGVKHEVSVPEGTKMLKGTFTKNPSGTWSLKVDNKTLQRVLGYPTQPKTIIIFFR